MRQSGVGASWPRAAGAGVMIVATRPTDQELGLRRGVPVPVPVPGVLACGTSCFGLSGVCVFLGLLVDTELALDDSLSLPTVAVPVPVPVPDLVPVPVPAFASIDPTPVTSCCSAAMSDGLDT